ncbi:hypothetical protein KKC87_04510 [Patescibacteria group bacterium]|nr:hypothetical protein [Patescibacteria group bacterium]
MVTQKKVSGLTIKHRALISQKIKKEARFKKRAMTKLKYGRKLTPREQKAVKRPYKQVVAIGFSKAREEDPTIPEKVFPTYFIKKVK